MKDLKLIASLMFFITSAAMTYSCATSNATASAKSGAQLGGENCMRCHNSPSPDTFSDSQWDVAVTHMRVRATLTQHESEKIIEFLKSAN